MCCKAFGLAWLQGFGFRVGVNISGWYIWSAFEAYRLGLGLLGSAACHVRCVCDMSRHISCVCDGSRRCYPIPMATVLRATSEE